MKTYACYLVLTCAIAIVPALVAQPAPASRQGGQPNKSFAAVSVPNQVSVRQSTVQPEAKLVSASLSPRLPAVRLLPGQATASAPDQIVAPLPGQIAAPLPTQVVRALPGQIIRPLPGQLVGSLPNQIVRSLPGQVVAPLPGQLVP